MGASSGIPVLLDSAGTGGADDGGAVGGRLDPPPSAEAAVSAVRSPPDGVSHVDIWLASTSIAAFFSTATCGTASMYGDVAVDMCPEYMESGWRPPPPPPLPPICRYPGVSKAGRKNKPEPSLRVEPPYIPRK